MRRGRESNPRVEDLQSPALPLRHHAFVCVVYQSFKEVKRGWELLLSNKTKNIS